MTFFFTWVDSPQPFDPLQHTRLEMDIFALSLIHAEGTYARLELTVQTGTLLPPQKWGILSIRLPTGESICLFQGARQDRPQSGTTDLMLLELIACPPDANEQLQILLHTWRTTTSVYDPLLIPEGHLDDPHLIRFFQPKTFYWDPCTLRVRLDDLLKGTQTRDVTSVFDPRSLTYRHKDLLPFQLHVTLQAQWIQQVNGFMNLGPAITKLFSEGLINTYTSASFKAAWPRAGQYLGRSNYWVAASRLEEIDPPASAARYSSPLHPSETSLNQRPRVARRRWFRGKLLVGWTFQQKRVEKLSFTLRTATPSKTAALSSETLSLRLQAICPPTLLSLWEPHTSYAVGDTIQEAGSLYQCLSPHQSGDVFSEHQNSWEDKGPLPHALPDAGASSFFLTPRGQKVLETGIEISHTKRLSQARTLEVSFEIPFVFCPVLSPSDEVTLSDPRLPCGNVRGKVLRTVVHVKGETGEQTRIVTLGVCLDDAKSLENQEQHAGPRTFSGILYLPYHDQKPEDSHANLAHARDAPRIKKLALLNGPEVQEALLQQAYAQSTRPSFQDVQTRILLKFHKLHTQEALTHHIQVTIPSL